MLATGWQNLLSCRTVSWGALTRNQTLRIACLVAALLSSTFLTGCVRDSGQKITEGVYDEPAKVEAVTVKGQDMTLQLNATKGPRLGIVTRTYRYRVLTNHELRFDVSSNDPFFVFEVLKYDWIWDGTNIIRKDINTDETVVFARRG